MNINNEKINRLIEVFVELDDEEQERAIDAVTSIFGEKLKNNVIRNTYPHIDENKITSKQKEQAVTDFMERIKWINSLDRNQLAAVLMKCCEFKSDLSDEKRLNVRVELMTETSTPEEMIRRIMPDVDPKPIKEFLQEYSRRNISGVI